MMLGANAMHKAIAHLPDGKQIVLGEFDTHAEAYAFINALWLGAL